MLSTFTVRRRVNFSETDLAGIMHFSNFFRWMEETEHAFYRSMGLSVHPLQHGRDGDTEIGWPRVAARCDYHAPLHFEEEADVQLTVTEIRTKAIRYRFHVRKLDGTVAALGELTVVAVQADPETRKMRAVPIPTAFREKITAADEPTAQS
jgi:YbgC/YbaW family acyl-CoA thioester hydrolase